MKLCCQSNIYMYFLHAKLYWCKPIRLSMNETSSSYSNSSKVFVQEKQNHFYSLHLTQAITDWFFFEFFHFTSLYSAADISLFACLNWHVVLLFICICFFKAYAISAILKIMAFEIALGRKIDMLPEVNQNLYLFRWPDFIIIH